MSEQWKPVANRGELALEVLTRRRALAEGVFLGECDFLLRLKPDGYAEHIDIKTPNARSVQSFIQEMAPHRIEIFVSPHEDADAVRAAISGQVH